MKGIYILLISIKNDTEIRIGALGNIRFKEGTYAYTGSAQNSLENRVGRHLSKNKKKFWHIDYLLGSDDSKIIRIYYKNAKKTEECETAKILEMTETPVKNFGCSDCRCGSHLFRIKNIESIKKLKMKELQQ
ncbi:MAG: GIY-YIG nuclease family protein [archaeon]|nr:GIY-YIG nuclease family protein [archaeon]